MIWETRILVNKIPLRQRQRLARFRCTPHAIRLYPIRLWVDFHLRLCIVELHVFLANVPAILHCFDALAELVRVDDARVDGRFGDECDAG
jgi:hypothetical protein